MGLWTLVPAAKRRALLTLGTAALAVAALVGVVPAAQATTTTTSFTSTGDEQMFTVPAGTTSLTVTAVAGNGGQSGAPGGIGARVDGAVLSVTPGQILYLEVGDNAF